MIDLWLILKEFLLPAMAAYLIYNEKDKSNMRNKVYSMLTRKEIESLIDLKLDSTEVEIQAIKEDVQEIKQKLDKIIDILTRR